MPHVGMLENVDRQVAEDERIVVEWGDLIGRMRAEGRDVTLACQLRDVFKSNLVARRSSRDQIEKMIAGRAQAI